MSTFNSSMRFIIFYDSFDWSYWLHVVCSRHLLNDDSNIVDCSFKWAIMVKDNKMSRIINDTKLNCSTNIIIFKNMHTFRILNCKHTHFYLYIFCDSSSWCELDWSKKWDLKSYWSKRTYKKVKQLVLTFITLTCLWSHLMLLNVKSYKEAHWQTHSSDKHLQNGRSLLSYNICVDVWFVKLYLI